MEAFDPNQHDQFLRLYVANEESLRGFVRSLVPTMDDARDVMQETAAILWRKFEQLDAPENFRRWAFGVARFEALAFRRDKARDRHVFSEDLLTKLANEASEIGEQASDEVFALQGCLKKLPEKQRSLVWDVYANEKRIDKMAEKAGRTPMALYKSLHRIRMSLAECVSHQLKRQT